MNIIYKELPLFSDTYYSYKTTLEGINYNLSIYFNERSNSWYLDLSTTDNVIAIQGLKIIPEYPLLVEYSLPSLSGFFVLLPSSGNTSEEYLTQSRYLDQYYKLYYVRLE